MLYIEKIDVSKVPLSEMQNFVCKARLEYAKKFPDTDGALGIACEFLLNKILSEHKTEFGLKDADFPLGVEHTKDGRAVFSKRYSQKMPYFSFSHSFDFACCAVSDKMVGIDIEKMRSGATKIAARYFCPSEVAWIFSETRGDLLNTAERGDSACTIDRGDSLNTAEREFCDLPGDQASHVPLNATAPETRGVPLNAIDRGDSACTIDCGVSAMSDSVERFFAMWTLKESFLKASGQAGKISMKDFSVECDIERKNAIYCHNVDNEKYMGKLLQAPLGYAMAVCLQE